MAVLASLRIPGLAVRPGPPEYINMQQTVLKHKSGRCESVIKYKAFSGGMKYNATVIFYHLLLRLKKNFVKIVIKYRLSARLPRPPVFCVPARKPMNPLNFNLGR
ncbi:hypothetical protein [Sporobacter termitidis]|uniref:hypothetical protein n=1 Tax=Sporobacter termitidis TaxID=44749 RepID=UPI001160A03E|nr:hypothetical protein [Sporobacter termitidis]